ncbi:MAG: hypothetical protein AABZ30_11315 [Myxococcota bacterium]
MHEADLLECGVEGFGVMGVEHHVTQAVAPERADEYENCLYACRLCNGARADRPERDVAGRRLLDPCRDAWADRFHRDGDFLRPNSGDGDAQYTHRVYDLDDPRKRFVRETRAARIREALRAIRECAPVLADLIKRAGHSDSRGARRLASAEKLRNYLRRAAADLERYRAIPLDADPACRCDHALALRLPTFLADQTLSVEADSAERRLAATGAPHGLRAEGPSGCPTFDYFDQIEAEAPSAC